MRKLFPRIVGFGALLALGAFGAGLAPVAHSDTYTMSDCTPTSIDQWPATLVPGETGMIKVMTDMKGPCALRLSTNSPSIKFERMIEYVPTNSDSIKIPFTATSWSGKT